MSGDTARRGPIFLLGVLGPSEGEVAHPGANVLRESASEDTTTPAAFAAVALRREVLARHVLGEAFVLKNRSILGYFHHVTKALTKCKQCKRKFRPKAKGRRPLYCSDSCRQRAYERRRIEKEIAQRIPMRLLGGDMEGIKTRDGVRKAIVDVLRELGLIARPPDQPKRGPKLRVIQDDED